MKMARASEADLEAALDLSGILENVEKGYYPSREDSGSDYDPTFFDEGDPEHLQFFYDRVMECVRKGSIFRVTFGMAVLLDPRNELLDPDADSLERHPKIVAALAAQGGA